MNAQSMDARRRSTRCRVLLVAAWMAAGLAAPGTAEASKMLRPAVVPSGNVSGQPELSPRAVMQTAMARRVDNYFRRALEARSTRATRQPGMQYFLVANEDGVLEDNSVVQYLTWRRSLNPTRFDTYHPMIGGMIRRSQLASVPPTLPQVPSTGGETPTPTGTLPPIVIGRDPSTQVPIPEPGTLAIGLVLAGSCVWVHRRQRAVAQEANLPAA